jgi:acyl-CoA thioester hydrolase
MPKSGRRRPGNAVHVFPVRVYYEDTDAAGIVYYANYLRYAERARTEMMRGIGMGSARMMAADGLAFAVRRCSVEFVKPAKLDDLLSVETRLVEIGGASIIADQRIKRAATELVRMELTLACMSLAGRPARLPAGLRSRLNGIQAMVR